MGAGFAGRRSRGGRAFWEAVDLVGCLLRFATGLRFLEVGVSDGGASLHDRTARS